MTLRLSLTKYPAIFFLDIKRFVVIADDDIAIGANGISGIGSGQPDYAHAGCTTGLQTVETVLEDDTLLWRKSKSTGSLQITVGIGLGTLEVFRRQDGVEHAVKFRVTLKDGLHLLLV